MWWLLLLLDVHSYGFTRMLIIYVWISHGKWGRRWSGGSSAKNRGSSSGGCESCVLFVRQCKCVTGWMRARRCHYDASYVEEIPLHCWNTGLASLVLWSVMLEWSLYQNSLLRTCIYEFLQSEIFGQPRVNTQNPGPCFNIKTVFFLYILILRLPLVTQICGRVLSHHRFGQCNSKSYYLNLFLNFSSVIPEKKRLKHV